MLADMTENAYAAGAYAGVGVILMIVSFAIVDLLTPGKVEAYALQMESNGWRVEKGHRLRVHVQSSAKHLVFPNTNTGNPPFDETDSIPAYNSVYHGGRYPSHIKLPILKI